MSEKVERMVITEDKNVIRTRCSSDGDRSVEVQSALIERPGESNGVRVQQRDAICPRRQVLRRSQCSPQDNNQDNGQGLVRAIKRASFPHQFPSGNYTSFG